MGLPVKAVMADNAVVWDLEALFNCFCMHCSKKTVVRVRGC